MGLPNPNDNGAAAGMGSGTRRGELVFAISADYEQRTGGWVYDTRVIKELAALGWHVRELVLPAGFPHPDEAARAQSAEAFARLADGTLVVTDQLCLGVLPEVAQREAQRLRLVMIVHHPLMLEEYGAGADDAEADNAFGRSEREALRHVRLAIVTSGTTAEFLRDNFEVDPSRIVIAPPGTDSRALSEGSRGSELALLSVGAVVPRKDHGVLIGALNSLRDEQWRLTIVGNITRAPDHVAAVRARIAAAGLQDKVHLAGELDDVALEEVWRGADIYVASSRHEGFGMAIAEAISRGLPVVTTAAGAVSGWLSSSAALIVPSGDTAALAAALARVLRQPETRAALMRGAREQRLQLTRWHETATRVDAALLHIMGSTGHVPPPPLSSDGG